MREKNSFACSRCDCTENMNSFSKMFTNVVVAAIARISSETKQFYNHIAVGVGFHSN